MALSWLDRLWSSIADRGNAWVSIPDATPLEQAQRLAGELLSGRGEASGAALARELLGRYRLLSDDDRRAFQRYLAENFAPPKEALFQAAQAYLQDQTPEAAMHLAEIAEPPRQELLRRINMGPGGTQVLVEMRRELLRLVRGEPALKPLEQDLRHLLGSWFNRGFLELRRIDWDSPAAVLEKLITYEAVHEIKGWDDLHRRLQRDRRCFGFFHPALPGEPLIFVEVALVEGIADKVQPLLSQSVAEAAGTRADTAIFYSISNCQEGLRGISFGNFLIKQVVEELRAELPGLRRFATLSPVPGFRRWLEARLAEGKEAENGAGDATALAELLAQPDWVDNPETAEALRAPLLRLCATYLTDDRGGAGPGDPVARFHLGNGARLEQVNWLANPSPRGLRESYAIMVNYLYDPDTIESNHEAFVRQGAVAHSAAVAALRQRPAEGARRPSLLAGLMSSRRPRPAPVTTS